MEPDLKLACADARQFDWPEFDVLITDPPYRAAVYDKATSHSFGKKSRGVRHRDMGFDAIGDELRDWTCMFAARARRWIVIFSDLESIGAWQRSLELANAQYVRTIPWVRWSMPQLSGDRPPQGAEAIVIGYGQNPGRKRWNGPGNLTHFAQKCLRGEGKHRAEKPLDLALALVDYFSDRGEMVADPFAGAGTFGLACRLLDRDYAGTEQDAEWLHKAVVRVTGPLSERDEERYTRWKASCAG